MMPLFEPLSVQDVIVLEADWPRFFCAAAYENDPDYINITLTSFVAETPEMATVRLHLYY